MRQPSISLPTFEGFDKLVHFVMYLGTCSIFWVEYYRSRLPLRPFVLRIVAVLLPVLMSGVIELAQSYFTETRSGDWFDFAANSLGVLIAWALSPLYRRLFKSAAGQ